MNTVRAIHTAPLDTGSPSAAASTSPGAAHLFHAAYDATAAERAALARSALLPVNLDVRAVTTTVLGALPRLSTLREAIATGVACFDLSTFDQLETYAKALAYAQVVYLAASTPKAALPSLGARATALRQQLVADAASLARRSLIDPKRLDELKGGTGYLAIASDLGVLVRIFRERWSAIASKCPIEPGELDEAEQLFERITLAYAERTLRSKRAIAATEDRQRAFTLVVNAYEEARRIASFLRWHHGDAENFAPSLWTGRGGRRRRRAREIVTPEPAAPRPSTSPQPGSPV